MFVKITNGAADQYPYTVGQLRRDNPNVSFPKNLSEERMAEYGMHRVYFQQETPDFDPSTQRTESSNLPVLIDGKWTITQSVVDLTTAEIQQKTEQLAFKVRKQRNNLLAESDWTQVADAPVDKAAWATYRQALRDITTQDGFPHNITWPAEP